MPLPAFTIKKEDFSNEDIENFWSKVDKKSANECWPWKLMKSKGGYGRLTFQSKDLTAHRVAYTFGKGPIEEGMQINHICCSRDCCNPNHLEVVTCKQNLEYAAKLGRMATGERHGSYTSPESVTRGDQHWTRANKEAISKNLLGENNPDSRLTSSQVLEIRSLYSTGQHTQKELAKRFGIDQTSISCIVLRKTWNHI